MFYVYMLKNRENKIYVGYTADLKQRVYSHTHGTKGYTKKMFPWKLVYYEAYCAGEDAQKREKTLKRYGSTLGQLKKRLSFSLR